ncbi:MAG: DUF1592 domain-containing protein [Vicinamibacterales bacterium]
MPAVSDAAAQTPVAQRSEGASSAPAAAGHQQELLKRYCYTCHNNRLKTAELSLETIDPANVGRDAPVWEKVLKKLRSGAMPPVGRPRPDGAAYAAFSSWLEGELDSTAKAHPQPGRTATFHRLNRLEYQNAVRDILGLEIDASSLLPGDDAAFGFDNIGEMLTVSPDLLDRYLSAANKVSRLAVGDRSQQLGSATYPISQYLLQTERMSEDLPFGSRGGAAIQHYFPADGEYLFKIRFAGNSPVGASSFRERAPQTVELRIDGARAAQLTTTGRDFEEPADVGAVETRVAVKAGPHVIGVSFPRRTVMAETRFPQLFPWGNSAAFGTNTGSVRYLNVAGVEVGGPHNPQGLGETPSRARIFTCRPAQANQEVACAKKILGTLARRAFRRPVTAADVQGIYTFYEKARADRDFDGAMQVAIERLLVDPDFLFRVERDPKGLAAGEIFRVDDLTLASRLSFFLWSSVPDEELLQLAEKGTLSQPAVLEKQVQRMLADPRSSTLVTNFASQWLYLRNIRGATPDSYQFPDWDDNLRAALARETELFLEYQIRENRSVTELLSAKYTFLNQRLAKHYGIPNVYGEHFRRVELKDEYGRGGLLGHGSIQLVTSFANRTSPVVRGKWLLENFLNYTPPPPPPNVPDLPPVSKDAAKLSLRQRVEQHRQNPVCAACHNVMDPLGFALENYDAIGRYRVRDEGGVIDSSGSTPDGVKFQGLHGLRSIMEKRQVEFVATVAEKLLTYALGRGVEYYDQPAIRAIVRDAAATNYTWSSIIQNITKSVPFQMKQGRTE